MARRILPTEHGFSERQRKSMAILDAIRRGGPVAKTDVSRSTQINIVTVSSYIEQFIARGLVVEKGLGHSRGGRIPLLVDLNRTAGFAIGIGWTLTDIVGVVVDLAGNPLVQERIPKPDTINEEVIKRIADLANGLIHHGTQVDPKKVKGIGIGIPGIIDETGHRIRWPHPPVGSSDVLLNVSVSDLFERRFQLPVSVINDADAAVFGEKWFSVEYEREHILYMYSGVSCGIMINGQIYGGKDGYAGELGIYSLKEKQEAVEAIKTTLGRWDTDLGIVEATQKSLRGGAQSLLMELLNGNIEKIDFRMILQAAERGDALAAQQLKQGAVALGKKIAFLVNLLNPELIVIGGGIEIAKHLILDTIRETVKEWAFEEATQSLKIVPSRLGDSAMAIGSACMMLRDVYMGV